MSVMPPSSVDRPDSRRLVELLRHRGIRDPSILRAMESVPREAFVPPELGEFAYEDVPLPIEEAQTISQPYVVALMVEAAGVRPGDRVLEVGTGSGYAAAILARVAGEVYTVERHATLAGAARERLAALGFHDVHVLHGDGTLGWEEHAPYDVILVAAGGPEIPPSLVEQLAPGGRLVIPIGETPREQRLVRFERLDGRLQRLDLGPVRFVPLIGEEGWMDAGGETIPAGRTDRGTIQLLRETLEPFGDIDAWDAGSFVERLGNSRVTLLGEATHGTSEFYRMRARITRELVERHGFRLVAIEGDWPDAARFHRWVRHEERDGEVEEWRPFSRFPTWMWRNHETVALLRWMREFNEARPPEDRVGFYGLDLYSMHRSIDAVVSYLDRVDPAAAAVARERYGCLTPWERDPAAYGRAVVTGTYGACEDQVVAMLGELLERRIEYMRADGDRFLDAALNARLVADAERYYRIMYRGGHESWNLRDGHMFGTLSTLLSWTGAESRAVVWAHNSHVGNDDATEMGGRGQKTIGGLCREGFGDGALLVGFGTDRGTVAAATEWGGPMERKALRPSRPGSYEALSHATDVPAFLLHLRDPVREEIREELASPRLERAVGVIYRPETELQSHYFQASLPWQFDAWIWFDETRAVTPLPVRPEGGVPETYPFGP